MGDIEELLKRKRDVLEGEKERRNGGKCRGDLQKEQEDDKVMLEGKRLKREKGNGEDLKGWLMELKEEVRIGLRGVKEEISRVPLVRVQTIRHI